MAYSFRRRKERVNYVDGINSENDSRNSDPDYSRSSSRRPIKRRNTVQSEIVDLSVNFSTTTRRRRGRPSRNGEAEDININKETSAAAPKPSLSIQGSSSSSEAPSFGKKTILSWLIECGLIQEDQQVCYLECKTKSVLRTGRITRGGILCNCCQKEFSVWAFEKHAGSYHEVPYDQIYLTKKGSNLTTYQITAWHEPREQKLREDNIFVPKEKASDHNDDACPICGDGGDLICCDKCPSTFHPHCMSMERVPHGDWSCPYCVCKYCGLGNDNKQFIMCPQCDKKFHWTCFKEFEQEAFMEALSQDSKNLFCGRSCREISEKLERLVGVRHGLDDSYSWRVISPKDSFPELHSIENLKMHQCTENNSKVAVAWRLMDESFETITDRHTGINVVQSLVYSRGANLPRINFRRFHTFILEKDDEIIGVATVRVHGRRIAEMPFIATEERYRGQGHCGILLAIIESNLNDLKVENLIIPSIPKVSKMWIDRYGFLDVSPELKREIASYNILMFPRAVRLQKDLTKCVAELDDSEGVEDNQLDNEAIEDNQVGNQTIQEPDPVERPVIDLNMPPEEE